MGKYRMIWVWVPTPIHPSIHPPTHLHHMSKRGTVHTFVCIKRSSIPGNTKPCCCISPEASPDTRTVGRERGFGVTPPPVTPEAPPVTPSPPPVVTPITPVIRPVAGAVTPVGTTAGAQVVTPVATPAATPVGAPVPPVTAGDDADVDILMPVVRFVSIALVPLLAAEGGGRGGGVKE